MLWVPSNLFHNWIYFTQNQDIFSVKFITFRTLRFYFGIAWTTTICNTCFSFSVTRITIMNVIRKEYSLPSHFPGFHTENSTTLTHLITQRFGRRNWAYAAQPYLSVSFQFHLWPVSILLCLALWSTWLLDEGLLFFNCDFYIERKFNSRAKY